MHASKFTTMQKKAAVSKLKKGYTVAQVSKEYGVSNRTLSRWKATYYSAPKSKVRSKVVSGKKVKSVTRNIVTLKPNQMIVDKRVVDALINDFIKLRKSTLSLIETVKEKGLLK